MGASHAEAFAEHMLDQGDKKHRPRLLTQPHTMQNGKVIEGIDRHSSSVTFDLLDRKTRKWVARMSVRTMPGCCGAAIFYAFSGTGRMAQKLYVFGLAAAKAAGYGLVLATLRANNEFEPGVYNQCFLNGKTGNVVKLFTTILPQKGKKSVEPDVVDGNEG